jgi:hypothetical protein
MRTTGQQHSSIACQLSSAELQKRKAEVIASLKTKVLSRQVLDNGYQYEFKGANGILDELMSFIKTEKQCCAFFDFDLSVSDTSSHIRLSITGPEGTKQFIETEMGM